MKIGLAKSVKAAPTTAHVVRHWFLTLGGPGLILLGLVDSSVIPIPGSMDAMTIVLSAHQHTWWPYYAVMATVGSVVGAYVTYRLARNRGEKALHDRLSKRNAKKVVSVFERWGFGAIALPALLPPPMPMVPFVIAAGALQYSPRNSCWRYRWADWYGIAFWRIWERSMGTRSLRWCWRTGKSR